MAADEPIVRIGLGTDLHRLVAGRPLRLAGVTVPFSHGLTGHSDADVVFHAVTDAVLGAAGLPDIGELFPDSDPKYFNADSAELLREAVNRAAAEGFRVACADVTIHAERPKISPYKSAMRANLACVMSIGPERVNLKAKTQEGVDAVGRNEAIACFAVVGLCR
ncbi:MAG: 2-C-methyl-D-erythritol 2,4-cyclodiphosphate synthase [Phycisphaerae bacterium]|nr:2-C-methyl-D-erythritol 2,4-cyclodiphosphate synthase [Phycisphaerae bacterium]NUQ44589.1 2-C-methyl-D-erythritol 2,4-cyclodiphosphate synthase [Phycisphaerae bacterium]